MTPLARSSLLVAVLLACAGCEGLSGLASLRVDPCFASDGGAGCAANDAAVLDPCAAPRADTLYVDGARGVDTSDGTCARPLRSLTKALARAGDTLSTARIFLFAATYSSETSAESFPIRITRRLIVEGEGEGRVSVVGGGPCEMGFYGPTCGLELAESVELRGLSLSNPAGTAVVSVTGKHVLRGVTIRDSASFGFFLVQASQAELVDVTFSANKEGIRIQETSELDMERVTFRDQETHALYGYTRSKVTSRACRFERNGKADLPTVRLFQAATWTSTDDVFAGNRGDAISLGEEECVAGTAHTLRGLQVSGSGRDGLRVYCRVALAMSGASVLGSMGSGVHFLGDGEGDVGGSAAAPNTLQSDGARANALAGVCNEGKATVLAQHARWSRCPPVRHTDGACAGAADVGGPSPVSADSCVP